MPRTFGDSLIHKSHVDVMVEVDYPLPELKTEEPNNVEKSIGKLIAENLVEDGATLQMGKLQFCCVLYVCIYLIPE
jgi:acyl-CoA hydrolase